MPTRQEHLDRASQSEALSLTLERGPYTDWAVTVMFYAALQLVDAHLLGLAMDPIDHLERLALVRRTAGLSQIWLRYRTLLDRSIDARYECQTFTAAQVASLRLNTFEPLKQQLGMLLA